MHRELVKWAKQTYLGLAEPLPGFTIRMTGDEQFTISDGQYKGMKGNFARTDGQITGINFADRLAVKQ